MTIISSCASQALELWRIADEKNANKVVTTQLMLELMALHQGDNQISAWDKTMSPANIKSAFFKTGKPT